MKDPLDRLMAVLSDPNLTVACPRCEASFGDPCLMENGGTKFKVHKPRAAALLARLTELA